MSVTWCGSLHPQNNFQGCQLIHSDSVSPQKCSILQFAVGKFYLWPYIFSDLWFWYCWQKMAYFCFMNCPWHVVYRYCIVWNIVAFFSDSCRAVNLGKYWVISDDIFFFWQLSLKCGISRTVIDRLLLFFSFFSIVLYFFCLLHKHGLVLASFRSLLILFLPLQIPPFSIVQIIDFLNFSITYFQKWAILLPEKNECDVLWFILCKK